MTPDSDIHVRHYVARAEQLIEAIRFFNDEPDKWDHVLALLSVHACIAFTDAILISQGGERSRDQDHKSVVGMLRRTLGTAGRNLDGPKKLEWLLGHKTLFSYGDKRLDREDVKRAVSYALSYQAWAYQAVPEMVRQREEKQ